MIIITREIQYLVHLFYGRISLYFEVGAGSPSRLGFWAIRLDRKEKSEIFEQSLETWMRPISSFTKNEEAAHALRAFAVTVIGYISSGTCNPDTCVHVDVSGDKVTLNLLMVLYHGEH